MTPRRGISGCRAVAYVTVLLSFCAAPATTAAAGELFIDLGRGPVLVRVPDSYDPETPTPLVMLLHGYSANGQLQEAYMQFAPIADEFGFIYLHPDGLEDVLGNQYWNGTDACCDFSGGNTDDSGYLRALIEEIRLQLNVDDRRVYIVGHSNGGFMSYRMACDHSDIVAAIVSLAGATFLDPADCTPTEPVHVLQIHGTNDATILYNGGCLVNCYPGAVQSVETWAAYDGCEIVGDNSARPIDLDAGLPGNETVITRYDTDCASGGSAELWTIVNGSHSPNLVDDFSRQVVEFFYAHPKPADTEIVGPDDFSAFRGFYDSGDLDSLLASDDSDLCYEPGIVLNPTEAPVTLDFVATLPNDSPSSLDVTIESSANTVGLELTFSFWNYSTNSWDVVGTDTQSLNADTVRTYAGVPADHVEVGTGEVRTRYEVRVVSFIFIFPWLDCVDQVFWTTS